MSLSGHAVTSGRLGVAVLARLLLHVGEQKIRSQWDRGLCGYNLGVGVCSGNGSEDVYCWSEPTCLTERPPEGWPSEQLARMLLPGYPFGLILRWHSEGLVGLRARVLEHRRRQVT